MMAASRNNNFSRKLTLFSFVLSVGILCFHADAASFFGEVLPAVGPVGQLFGAMNLVLTSLGNLGVSFFFMSSAFLLYYNLGEAGSTGSAPKSKLLRRLKTLLLPFLLWNLIGIGFEHDFSIGLPAMALHFLLSDYCGVMWFVQALLLFLLLMPLVRRLFRVPALGWGVTAAALVLTWFGWFLPSSAGPAAPLLESLGRILKYIPIYLVGAGAGLCFPRAVLEGRLCPKRWQKALLALLFLLGFWYYAGGAGPAALFLERLQALFLWLLVPDALFTRPARWWMQLSFYTFACHRFVLDTLATLLRKAGLRGTGSISMPGAVAWRLGMTLAVLPLVLASGWVLIRFLPRLYELLTGGRLPDPLPPGCGKAAEKQTANTVG